jgi:hypothetical protein
MDDDKVFVAPQSDNSNCLPKRRWSAPRVITPLEGLEGAGKSQYNPYDNCGYQLCGPPAS